MTSYNVLINGILYDGNTIVSDVNMDGNLEIIVCTSNSSLSGLYIYSFKNFNVEVISKFFWNEYINLGNLGFGKTTSNSSRILLLLLIR